MNNDHSEAPLDDHAAYRAAMIANWEHEREVEDGARGREFAALLSEFGLTPANTRCDHSLVIAVADGLLATLSPKTYASRDGDGLCDMPAAYAKMAHPGYIGSPDDERLLLIPAVAFRRWFGDRCTYNEKFFGSLVSAATTHAVTPRLRFSSNEIGIRESYQMCMESDFWRGAKELADLRDLEDGHLKRHTYYDDSTAYLSGYVSAEIHAQGADDKGVRGIRLEEVHDEPHTALFADGESRIAERFVHAELYPDGTIGHLDGALRGYDETEWNARRDIYSTDLRGYGRVCVYEKQFRIDAPLSQAEFADIALGFFWGNHLMIEILEGLGETVESA